MTTPIWLGVDVGGTTTEVLAIDATGRDLGRLVVPTTAGGGEAVTATIVSAVEHVVAELDRAPTGLGVGIPGQVDPVAGDVQLAVNLRIDAESWQLASTLTERTGIPAVVENDVRVGALGALQHLRVDRPTLSDLVYLSVGTGIAAGVIVDGRLQRGHSGMAGEIGHVLTAGDEACACGLRGCLETVAAGPAIARLWSAGDADHLFTAAGRGETEAAAVAGPVIDHLVTGLRWLVACHDPELVALGGGVGGSTPLLGLIQQRLQDLGERSQLARRLLEPQRVVSLPASVGVGARGAAALAARRLEDVQSPTG